MSDDNERSLAVGDVVHGFCGGIFGRDHYRCCRVEAIAVDWAVFRYHKGDHWTSGLTDFVSGMANLDNLRAYREPIPPRPYADGCGCVSGEETSE